MENVEGRGSEVNRIAENLHRSYSLLKQLEELSRITIISTLEFNRETFDIRDLYSGINRIVWVQCRVLEGLGAERLASFITENINDQYEKPVQEFTSKS